MEELRGWPWPDGVAAPVAAEPLSGGMICTAVRARLRDGTEVVAKRCAYDPRIEADGLAALRGAGAPTPDVLGWALGEAGSTGDPGPDGQDGVLVLEHVSAPPPSDHDWAQLGATLAAVHRGSANEAAAGRRGFGWHIDNRIGWLVQRNAPVDGGSWAAFYAERRVRDHLDDEAVPGRLRRRLEVACDGPLRDLLPDAPPASLVHGDLWAGNVVDGRWLVDPAVQRADRELELAYIDLFGGLPAAFVDAYRTAWPLADGWRERRPALQLHNLLVHVRHFERDGPGRYASAVADRLDHYGW